ncbi:MAG: hypothetical protein GY771_06765 [bacterium]|nr:hypothetical protein [bacterium]
MKSFKIIVFVTEDNLDDVRTAMARAGAGVIGDYTHCSFTTPGTGTFLGGEDSDPTVGKKGKLETVPEWRLEMLVSEDKLKSVIAAMKSAHSYEEIAYDVYELVDV